MRKRRSETLPRLTSLRWYAALAVYLYHLSNFMQWAPLNTFSFGQTGVAFFFVLSGFVLAWSTPVDLPAKAFYRRRFARIYPSYLVMLAIGGALVLSWRALHIRGGSGAAVLTLLVVQAWLPVWKNQYVPYSFDPPMWSLSCEAFFYAGLPVLNHGLRKLQPLVRDELAVAWLVAAALVSEVQALHGDGAVAFSDPLLRSAEFIFGMVLAMKVQAGWRPRIPVAAAVTIMIAACWLARLTDQYLPLPMEDYVVVVPTGLLLVAGAVADLERRTGILTRRLSVYLGEVSFAFYLVHYLSLLVALKALGWGHSWSGWAGFAPLTVTFLASFAAASALHHFVELPFQRVLRGRGSPSIATVAPARIMPELG